MKFQNDQNSTSIIQRLQQLAIDRKVSTQVLRTEFLLERLLARIAASPKASNSIVFKGGMVSKAVYQTGRFTRDLDLAPAPSSESEVVPEIKKAIRTELKDGAWYEFLDETPLAQQTIEGGIRLRIRGGIGAKPENITKATALSIDITFTPVEHSHWVDYPTLLDADPFRWRVCAREVTIADKLSALLTRGSDNTRSRDVFDLAQMLPGADKKLIEDRLRYIFKLLQKLPPADLLVALRAINHERLKSGWNESLLGVSDPPTYEESWNVVIGNLRNMKITIGISRRRGTRL